MTARPLPVPTLIDRIPQEGNRSAGGAVRLAVQAYMARPYVLFPLTLALASCALGSSPRTTEIPDLEASRSTLYVLEVYDDFLDDGGKLHDPREGTPRSFGDAAMGIILRAARKSEKVRVVGFAHAQLKERELNVIIVEESLHYLEARSGAVFALTESPHRGFFKVATTPLLSQDGKCISLDYALLRGVPNRQVVQGTGLQAGKPTSISETTIEDGSRVLPVGGTAVWHVPRGDGRMFLILLHLAALDRSVRRSIPPTLPEWVEVAWCNRGDFRKLIAPRLRDRGIPTIIPDEVPYILEESPFNFEAFYCPPEQALEARRIASEALQTKKWSWRPGAFTSLGNAWIFVGSASTEDAHKFILPLLKSEGFECREGAEHLGTTGIYVVASRCREAETLIAQEMKSRGRPFDPAATRR